MKHFCEALWEYDPETNQIYMHHDNMTPELCGKWNDYDEVFALYQKQYIHKLDVEKWNALFSPDHMKEICRQETPLACVHIHFLSQQGRFEWHEVFRERTEKGRLLLGSRDINQGRRNEIIVKSVENEFDYVCYIDVASRNYSLYPSGSAKGMVPESLADNYPQVLRAFNKAAVVPEEYETVTSKMEMDHVIRELQDKDEYVLYATIQEDGKRFYKKLRFCYENETKETLLLSRVDISDVIHEQQRRRQEEQKRLDYLDNLPIACCITQVLLDEENRPYDFMYTYHNREHARLEEVEYGDLIGKKFYEFFQETDRSWLQDYYETAYEGITHVLDRYSPEIKKHLLIYTFQPEYGFCGCVVQDITEGRFLEQELEKSRQEMRHVLEATTDLVFQYDLQKEQFLPLGAEAFLGDSSFYAAEFINGKNGLVEPEYTETLKQALARVRDGAHELSLEIRARVSKDSPFAWYKTTFFDYVDAQSHQRCVLGYMQNIEQLKRQQELLQEEAQRDALTGVLNSRAGKREIKRRLEQKSSSWFSMMFIMDIDDFKQVNDVNGHMTGDETLREFARILQRTFRTEDVIYRLGGDEFVVFADCIQDPELSIAAIMKRFFERLSQSAERGLPISSSVGVFATDRACGFEEYYKQADQALYETKKSGKNDYTMHVERMVLLSHKKADS